MQLGLSHLGQRAAGVGFLPSSGGRSMNGLRDSARVTARSLAMQGMVIASVLISLASWAAAAMLLCLI
jgi:hypothetical protein